jgi:uncharacterized protein YprB with RNaseH-like and TPR domain
MPQKRKMTDAEVADLVERKNAGATYKQLVAYYKKKTGRVVSEEVIRNNIRTYGKALRKVRKTNPKILFLDIETAPMLGFVWSLWENNVALNQIHKDWHLLSWAAKWKDRKEIMYQDQSDVVNIEDDSELCRGMWKLLDEADIIVTQNGKKFDVKKLNARFIHWNMQPPSSYRHIDTLEIAKSKFGFTSNKLEYLADKLTTKKKMMQRKFSGFALWKECLDGNPKAWAEMKKYNKMDIVTLEALYNRLAPWSSTVQFNVYADEPENKCNCGSTKFTASGYHYTNRGKYQRYRCDGCGQESYDTENLIDTDTRKTLRKRI